MASNTNPIPSRPEAVMDKKPLLDNRKFEYLKLNNGLQALLVHDPDTNEACAALQVGAGYFSERKDQHGYAHACARAIFMGSNKLPDEHAFREYISINSGEYNASSGPTSTTFYFTVASNASNDESPTEENPSPLRGALSRFGGLFEHPQFPAERLAQDIKIIDAAHTMRQQVDELCISHLLESLCNPKHPRSHFGIGNLDTLKHEPESRGIDVRSEIENFWSRHYSANLMTVVIVGKEQLDVLQKWAEQAFSSIEDKKLPQNRWEDELPLRPQDLGMQTFARPRGDYQGLHVEFQYIDEEHLYEAQPSRYLAHLIAHPGDGSIVARLKQLGWAHSLRAGAIPICPGSPSLFRVSIELTEEGLKNYREVVKIFFQYTSILCETPPERWIYEEVKAQADLDFKCHKPHARDFAVMTCAKMQTPIPREWLFRGSSHLWTFNPEVIQRALATLKPGNMHIMLVSNKVTVSCDQKEKWYGTAYRRERISDVDMSAFRDAAATSKGERPPELHLPRKNSLIQQRLDFETHKPVKAAAQPLLVRNDNFVTAWWKEHGLFCVPKARIRAILRNPLMAVSCRNLVMAELCADLVQDSLEKDTSEDRLAGLKHSVAVPERDIIIDIWGYRDKLLSHLKKVVVAMKKLEITEERFLALKELTVQRYNDWGLKPPKEQTGYYLANLSCDQIFLPEDMLAEAFKITFEDVQAFQKQILAQMHLETFCYGDMRKEEALRAAEIVESTFKSLALPRSQLPIVRSNIIPAGTDNIYAKTLPDPLNNCVEKWLYIGDRADHTLQAKTALFAQIARKPGLDQLGYEESLGYGIHTGQTSFQTTTGFRVLVQSERTPVYVDSRIEAFLLNMGAILTQMSDVEFEGHKRSVIAQRLKTPNNMNEEFNRYSRQIVNGYYDFDWHKSQVECIKTLTKADMISFYSTHISPRERATISVHLHAQRKRELDANVTSTLQDAGRADLPLPIKRLEEAGLTDTAPSADRLTEESACIGDATNRSSKIDNVREFNASLSAGPAAKPVAKWSTYSESHL